MLSEGGKISFTESQLTITNVQEENDGFYECIASNAFGSNITSAKLSVNSEWVWNTLFIARFSLRETCITNIQQAPFLYVGFILQNLTESLLYLK